MCKTEIVYTFCGIPVSSFKQRPTPSEIAAAFCHLTDDRMAEFFVAVRAIEATWDYKPLGWPGAQWEKTGEHMAECPGSLDSNAIGIVEGILEGYKYRQSHPLNNVARQGDSDQSSDIARA